METLHGEKFDLSLVTHIGTQSSHAAQRIQSWHTHREFELLFVMEGATAWDFQKGRTIELSGGQFLVIPPRTMHRGARGIRMPSTMCGLLVDLAGARTSRNSVFDKHDLRRMQRQLSQCGLQAYSFGGDLRRSVAELVRDKLIVEKEPDNALNKASLRLRACAVILGMLREVSSLSLRDPAELVVAAKAYLGQHLAEPIRVSDMIDHLGLSRSRIFDLFKSMTGITPNDYLLRLRIEKARHLLAQSTGSVTGIALELGFSSSQYFSSVFRKYTGQTPMEYRRINV